MLEHERHMILTKAHEGIAGGHYGGKTTAQKILCTGLWGPTLHKYAKEHCQSCDVCQRVGNPSRRDEITLNPKVTLQAFDKWAIDFVGLINPQTRRSRARYIITTTKFLTRWEKETPVTNYTMKTPA
jgi:hypothetical protein